MLVFTEHEVKKFRSYLIIACVSVGIWYFTELDILQALGLMFAVLFVSDVFFNVTGRFLAKIMFKEVIPKSVKELKHSEKQFQYVLKLPKRDLYSYVYNKPLKDVNVKCWEYMGSYMIGVTKKKKEVTSREEKI